jgi:NADH-quinone oxidoreductase subunit L
MTFWGDFKGWKIVPRWRPPKHAHHGHDEPTDYRLIQGPAPIESPRSMTLPLALLAAGAAAAGFLYAEPIHLAPLEHFMQPVFHTAGALVKSKGVESLLWPMMGFGVAAFIVGAGASAYVYYSKRGEPARAFTQSAAGALLHRASSRKLWVDEIYDATVIGLLDAMGETAAQFDKWVIDGVIAKLTALLTRLFGTALRAIQTGRVQVYAASIVVGLAAVGWFLFTPQAEARVDDAKLQRSGKVTFQAAPGLGYVYRWTPEGETARDAFDGGTDFSLELAACERKSVRLDVRNAVHRSASRTFSVCRMVPALAGCCGPDTVPVRAPNVSAATQEPPAIAPGTYDAGVLQDLLSPPAKPGAAAQGGRP